MVKNSQQTRRKIASQHSLNGLGSFQGNPLGYTQPRKSLRSCLVLAGIQGLSAFAIKPIDPLSFICHINFSHRLACPTAKITLVLLKHFRKRNDSNWKCPLLKEILYNRTEKHTIRETLKPLKYWQNKNQPSPFILNRGLLSGLHSFSTYSN